jgi:UDP-glucose 4-epimerase
MVTHDRYFLERVCNEIIELDHGELHTYKGNYSYYLEKKEARIENQATEVGKAKQLFKKELEWMLNKQGLLGYYKYCQFRDEFFKDTQKLQEFVSSCDVIVHLAAMNRHHDPQVIYETNKSLVKKLITACETTRSTPHILFSSSTQEERDNLYGRSKKEGRELLEKWAKKYRIIYKKLNRILNDEKACNYFNGCLTGNFCIWTNKKTKCKI